MDNKTYRYIILWIGSCILLIMLLLVALLLYMFYFKWPSDNTGFVGDTIGGISAPFIGLVSAFLTFLAFYIQYDYNKKQDIRISKQEKENRVDKFETRFYSLLTMHRENVSEISIKDVSKGRRTFISMFNEFRFCYYVLYKLNKNFGDEEFKLTVSQMIDVSFVFFMYGIGGTSNDVIRDILSGHYGEIVDEFNKELKIYQDDWKESIKTNVYHKDDTFGEMFVDNTNGKNIKLAIRYKPFGGHLSRLNIYFRNLYNIVKYVDGQPNEIVTLNDKINYLTILRAQLSPHEQLLLYYNSISSIGIDWRENEEDIDYLNRYRLVRNIPVPLANFGPDIFHYFNEEYFEWNKHTVFFFDELRYP